MTDQHTATHCTVELAHGGTVHVGEDMRLVMEKIRSGRRGEGIDGSSFISLRRIDGDPAVPRAAKNWPNFEVDAKAVIAVFPIDQGSVPIHNPAAL